MAQDMAGGEKRKLSKGDILWIPAGLPHVHNTSTTARMFIIKIRGKEIVPIESVPGWK